MLNPQRKRPSSRTRGQAIPVGLVGVAVMTILALTVFDTSQITSQKMRLANAADAAVYSGLVWEARALNYQAYLNRAMVANQVSVAQAVSLASWAKYGTQFGQNVATIGSVIPGPIMTASNYVREELGQLNNNMDSVARALIVPVDGLIRILSGYQEIVHYWGGLAAQSTLHEVVKANDPAFNVGTGAFTAGAWYVNNYAKWTTFTERYADEASDARMAGIIQDSLDGFATERNWDFGAAAGALGLSGSAYVKKFGTTRLYRYEAPEDPDTGKSTGRSEWMWKAKDTLSLHNEFKIWGFEYHEETPIAWGEALVSANNQDLERCWRATADGDRIPRRCGAWTENSRAERLAANDTANITDAWHGMHAYRDLKGIYEDAKKRPKEDELTLPLSVEVTVARKNTRTSDSIDGLGSAKSAAVSRSGIGEGMFHLDAKQEADVLSTVSRGEVYFDRPVPRDSQYGATDRKIEYASLFNPYWDVRLADPKHERIAVWALRGLNRVFGGGGGGVVPGS